MKTPENVHVLFTTRYGSHLYGTNTPTSDLDEKVVYLPALEDVLLGRKLRTFKTRVDAEGNPVSDTAQMPDGGVEVEYVPFQTFCRDFLNGQTYALECAFAHLSTEPVKLYWVKELVEKFLTCNVSSMAGFAKKQTFDYVHRGERLEKARELLVALEVLLHNRPLYREADLPKGKELRLDTVLFGEKVLHALRHRVGLELGTTVNNGREMETLKLNGRDYLETTTVEHLRAAVQKLVDSYGHRTQAAAEAEVDRKSLMHAVRVFEQALELLQTGRMLFPRPNAEYLLDVKHGNLDLEEVKQRLLELEDQVAVAQESSKLLSVKTLELEAAFDEWLLIQLVVQYQLPPGTV